MEGNNLDINPGKDKAYKPWHENHKQGAFCSVGGNRVQAHKENKRAVQRTQPRVTSPLAEALNPDT